MDNIVSGEFLKRQLLLSELSVSTRAVNIAKTMRGPAASFDHKNIKLVRSHVIFDRRMTVRMIADELNIGKLSMHTVLIYKL